METQDKKSKILRGNSTLRGLSNNTKHGPLQTHETVPLNLQYHEDVFNNKEPKHSGNQHFTWKQVFY